MSFKHPQYLVETDWLQDNLEDPNLRVLDCTVYLTNYFDESAGRRLEIVSGRAHWEEGHIPVSGFADLMNDLCDPDNKRFFAPMPKAEQFAAVMSHYGVGPGTRVVLYDDMVNIWAARIWWMLRYFGFEEAAVLNGGFKKWKLEGRPVSTEPPAYPPARFVARPRPSLVATREEVLAAIGSDATCIINALDADEYAGRGPVRYGRPGHIPTSTNASFLEVLDLETNAYRSESDLREIFERAGAFDKQRVVTYCGGGIAASGAAFLLTLLGHENVALYDGSMTEWAPDPSLPLVTGDAS
jgi:thiosulfate/3-mercaptopyruvate sulfurtransferase